MSWEWRKKFAKLIEIDFFMKFILLIQNSTKIVNEAHVRCHQQASHSSIHQSILKKIINQEKWRKSLLLMTNAAFPQDLSRMCIWKLKYSSKIHCQIDLLLVWSTHNSFYHHCQASTFFYCFLLLLLHFPVIVHFSTHSHEAAAAATGLIIILSHIFICDENSWVYLFAAYHWCHTCERVWVEMYRWLDESMGLKNWIYTLKCTWHARFFYVKSWRWYLGNWVVTEYWGWNSITAPLFMARFTILWNLQMMWMHTKLNLFS